jgi:hypothetical protein
MAQAAHVGPNPNRQYFFTVRDGDTLDACYSHSCPNGKIVTCFEWKRVK